MPKHSTRTYTNYRDTSRGNERRRNTRSYTEYLVVYRFHLRRPRHRIVLAADTRQRAHAFGLDGRGVGHDLLDALAQALLDRARAALLRFELPHSGIAMPIFG